MSRLFNQTDINPSTVLESTGTFFEPALGDWTYSAWVYPTGWGAGAPNLGNGWIMGFNQGTTDGMGHVADGSFELFASSPGPGGYIQGNTAFGKQNSESVSADNVVFLNQWQYVTMVFVSATGITHFYVNGIEVPSYKSQTASSGSSTSVTDLSVGNGGYSLSYNSNAYAFGGYIDTVGVWSDALTPAEILQASYYGNTPLVDSVGLTGYWPLTGAATPEPESPTNTNPLAVPATFEGGTFIAPTAETGFNSPGQTPLTISGALGAAGAGATVFYSGAASGSVTADGSGNYTITGLIAGTYTVTPSLVGKAFSPTSQTEIVTNANLSSVNFITFKPAKNISGDSGIFASGPNFAARINSPSTVVIGTNLNTEIRK